MEISSAKLSSNSSSRTSAAASSRGEGLVVFLTGNLAQTLDALQVVDHLQEHVPVRLLLLESESTFEQALSCARKKLSHQVLPITSGLPVKFNQLYQILIIRRTLRRYQRSFRKIVLVIGSDWVPVQRSIVDYAKRRGIFTILIQDGLICEKEKESESLNYREKGIILGIIRWVLRSVNFLSPPTIYGLGGCDLVAVMGKSAHHFMTDRGIPGERLKITGSPRFDPLFSLANSIRTEKKHPGKKRRVLFVSFLFSSIYGADLRGSEMLLVKTLEEIASNNSEIEITVRPHPREDINDYRNLFERIGVKCLKLDQDTPIMSVLEKCDLLLSYPSTVVLEGMILGKTCICPAILPGVRNSFYAREHAVVVVEDLKDMEKTILAILHEPEQQRKLIEAQHCFLAKYHENTDGQSGERMAKIIQDILSTHDNRSEYYSS